MKEFPVGTLSTLTVQTLVAVSWALRAPSRRWSRPTTAVTRRTRERTRATQIPRAFRAPKLGNRARSSAPTEDVRNVFRVAFERHDSVPERAELLGIVTFSFKKWSAVTADFVQRLSIFTLHNESKLIVETPRSDFEDAI